MINEMETQNQAAAHTTSKWPTPGHFLEAICLYFLTLGLLVWVVPQAGKQQAVGLILVALVLIYGFFFSPYLKKETSARQSRFEAIGVFSLTLALVWLVLPLGPLWKRGGEVSILLISFFIFFLSPRRHADTLEDRGMTSFSAFWEQFRSGKNRTVQRIILIGGNFSILAAYWMLYSELPYLVSTSLKRLGGLKMPANLPPLLWLAVAGFLFNVFVIFLTRWDNISSAGGWLVLYAFAFVTMFSATVYWYFSYRFGFEIEFDLVKGAKKTATYIVWGTFQELIFLSYFNTRIRKGMTNPLLSAVLTAMIFSLFHLRAYTIMALCFGLGFFWALMFQAAPNLACMGLTHALSGGFPAAFSLKGITWLKIKSAVGPFN